MLYDVPVRLKIGGVENVRFIYQHGGAGLETIDSIGKPAEVSERRGSEIRPSSVAGLGQKVIDMQESGHADVQPLFGGKVICKGHVVARDSASLLQVEDLVVEQDFHLGGFGNSGSGQIKSTSMSTQDCDVVAARRCTMARPA